MSTLDDARWLASDRWGLCPVCYERLWPMASVPEGAPEREPGQHRPGCRWQSSLPKIVAALEAAERVVGDGYPSRDVDCWHCGGEAVWVWTGQYEGHWHVDHTSDCSWQALVAALKGEDT